MMYLHLTRLARVSAVITLTLIAAVAPGTALAADGYWDPSVTGCDSNFFDASGCWSGGFIPADTDNAILNSSLSFYELVWDLSTASYWADATGSAATTVTSQSLLVQNGGAALISFDGNPYTYKILNDVSVNNNGTLNVGIASAPMVLDADGDTLIDSGGNIIVSSTGSALNNTSGAVTISNGSLNVLAGGQVNSYQGNIGAAFGSSATVTVAGSGSSWNTSDVIRVGNSGQGTLNILNGGSVVQSNLGASIGNFASGVGVVNVDGAGSTWSILNHELYVGYFGNGTLNISNGGSVLTDKAFIGFEGASVGEVNVSGTGSSWTNTSNLIVGHDTTGTLNIGGGGSVVSQRAYIGDAAGSSGTVNVDGAGSLLDLLGFYALNVGGFGNGTLNITSGGSVASYHALIGNAAGSSGTVNVDGAGSLLDLASMGVGGDTGNATLNISNGGTVSVRDLTSIDSYTAGASAIVNVDGVGSSLISGIINVGNLYADGESRLNISNGGSVSASEFASESLSTGGLTISNAGLLNTDRAYFSYYWSSNATATVSGAGSVWNNASDLFLGGTGYGELTLEDGATVNTSAIYLGGGSSATVDIRSGATLNADAVAFGSGSVVSDAGALNIDSGGSLNTDTMTLGQSFQVGQAAVSVDGSGSALAVDSLLAVGANSRLTIRNGARANVGAGGLLAIKDGGRVTLSNAGTTFVSGFGGSIAVGESGAGTLLVEDGATVSSSGGVIGTTAGSMGTATLAGNGSSWNLFDMTVGEAGSGLLNIESGASVLSVSSVAIGNLAGSDGAATVSGAGSSWTSNGNLMVGINGAGSLSVENGASVTSQQSHIGDFYGSTGTVTVTGAGSSWTSNNLIRVGNQSSGTLNIENGGSVINLSTGASIGNFASGNGTVNVRGAGSSWSVSHQDVYVGYFGTGELNIENGGSVNNIDGYLGFRAGSNGTANVGGAGSTWTNTGNLYVGGGAGTPGGNGTLNINAGATVTVANQLEIQSTGTVNLAGGTLDADTINAAGNFNMTGGSLNANAFIGDLANQGGTLGPGDGFGPLTIAGDYSQDTASSLIMEIGSVGHDVLNVSGTATLGGTLILDVQNPLSWQVGDSIDLLFAHFIFGQFDSVTGYELADELYFVVSYDANMVTATVAAVPVPAALWLFSSALIGLVGVSRFKRAS